MTRPVTRTSRFRKIWISSLRAMASMSRFLSCAGVVCAVDRGSRGVEGAEDVVETGRAGLQLLQLHAVVVCPRQESVEILLEMEGLEAEAPVERPDDRRLGGARGQLEVDDRRKGLRELCDRAFAVQPALVHE